MTRTAIVTGAASGIGFATARRLAADGWDIASVDVDESGLARTAAAVEGSGRRHLAVPFDLFDAARFSDVVGRVVEWGGPPGLLVNDAGVGVAADILGTEPEDWDRVLGLNLTALYHTCRAVIPVMLDHGGGVIVNLGSVAGVVGLRNRLAYCASKHGVVGLTRAIAADFADRGIRANAICPGTVDTEWIGKILSNAPDPAATRKAMEARQLDGRMGSPEEVAAGIAFLASDDGRFVNGSAWVMDGGMTAV